MAHLDLNYLDLIRTTLYSSAQEDKTSHKRRMTVNSPTRKPTKLIREESQRKTFKVPKLLKEKSVRDERRSQEDFVVTTKKISPSLSNGNEVPLKKSRNRQASAPDEIVTFGFSDSTKKKKSKHVESLNLGVSSTSPTCNEKAQEQITFSSECLENTAEIVKKKKSKGKYVTISDSQSYTESTVAGHSPLELNWNGRVNKKLKSKGKANEIMFSNDNELNTLSSPSKSCSLFNPVSAKSTGSILKHSKTSVSSSKEFLVDFNSKQNHSYKANIKKKKHLRENVFFIEEPLLPASSPEIPSPEHSCNIADFEDDEAITVKGFKFNRLCSLFQSTPNEHIRQCSQAFLIPKRHFDANMEEENMVTDENVNEVPTTSKEFGNIDDFDQNSMASDHNSVINVVEPGVALVVENNFEQDSESSFESSDHNSTINVDEPMVELDVENNFKQDPAWTVKWQDQNDIIQLKDGSKVLILEEPNKTIYFHGFCSVRVLNGLAEILGAFLDRDSLEVNVYSPRGSSLLYLRNNYKLLSMEGSGNKIELTKVVDRDLLQSEHQTLIFDSHCAIILCKRINERYIQFLEHNIAQKIFPEADDASGQPRLDFRLSGSFNKTVDSDEWADILDHVTELSQVVICGGKGVGKSTFLRYAVNWLLGRNKKIRVIDLDPGQSEFCPPGCVSISTVEHYILGPSYTHLQTPDCSILSHIDISHNIKQYTKSVMYLSEMLKSMEPFPTLINFPGFTQGIGLDISVTALKILKPTRVLEIKSTNPKKDYKLDLTVANVKSIALSTNLIYFEDSDLTYEYTKLKSQARMNEAWSLGARQSREMCILSYFGKMMSASAKELTYPDLPMFSINLSALKVVNQAGEPISPLTINANIVALCSISAQEPQLLVSYGFGFVRGLDVENDLIVILTPEPLSRLNDVTHLVLSSVTTPPSLLMSAGAVEGQVPYIHHGDVVDFGQLIRRSYLPPGKQVSVNLKMT